MTLKRKYQKIAVIGAIIILFVVGFSSYYLGTKVSSQTTSSNAHNKRSKDAVNIASAPDKKILEDGWRSYINYELGFGVDYPQEWSLTEHQYVPDLKQHTNGHAGSIIRLTSSTNNNEVVANIMLIWNLNFKPSLIDSIKQANTGVVLDTSFDLIKNYKLTEINGYHAARLDYFQTSELKEYMKQSFGKDITPEVGYKQSFIYIKHPDKPYLFLISSGKLDGLSKEEQFTNVVESFFAL